MIDIKTLQKDLLQKTGLKNPMELPKLEKVVLNVGAGQAAADKKYIDEVIKNLEIISGQKPVVTKAKKAISGFKIRQGDTVGAMVTLRGKRMYDFLEKLIAITLPRIRDFKGLSLKHFDKQGNYSFAVREQIVFTEIPYDDVQNVHGIQITIKIKNSDPDKSKMLLESIGFPFEKAKEKKNG